MLTEPTEPRRVVVNPIDWNGNTGLYVSWDPPDAHNGILDTYSVYYRKKPWDVDQIYQKDFCHEGMCALLFFSVTSEYFKLFW